VLDQNSRNGTLVNGARVHTAQLTNGDVIELGAYGPRLHVVIDAYKPAQVSPESETTPQFNATARVRAAPTARWNVRDAAMTVGLYNPQHDSGEAPRSISVGLLSLLCAVLGVMVLGLTVLDLGLGVALLSGFIAFVPALFYLSIFLWIDRYDPEPARTLGFAFAWGAIIAVFFSAMGNGVVQAIFGERPTAMIAAPIIEEASKGLGVVLIALLFRHDFDSVVDGIVYAGVVALGFAAMENVDYYGRSFNARGEEGLIGTFFVRGVMSPFAHLLFTAMTGIGCGIARETHKAALKVAAPLGGFCLAMLLHALWNVLASFDQGTWLIAYFLLEVPLFCALLVGIIFVVRREGRILRQTLLDEVARGLLTKQQLEIAISVFRRTWWIAAAFGDQQRFNARRQFLRTVAKLGLCHWHKARAADAQKETGSFSMIAKLQAEVWSLRDRIG
jgi:protease PrsW